MDPYSNPFAPGAGCTPPELAGRDDIFDEAAVACGRAARGRNARPMMLLGLRGTGKTVLLQEIAKRSRQKDCLVTFAEASEGKPLAHLLYPEMRETLIALSNSEQSGELAKKGFHALKSFASVCRIRTREWEAGIDPSDVSGPAASGDLQRDLADLFKLLGNAAQSAGKVWVLLIDEVQYLQNNDLSALIVVMHQVAQLSLPIVFVGAGLPQIARLAGEARSCAERQFHFNEIGNLSAEDAEKAVRKPLEEEKASITQKAMAELFSGTQGYPFFLQAWAFHAWNIAEGPAITEADIAASCRKTIGDLDSGFFRVRFDRLSKTEIRFVEAMASLGDGPYAIGKIAEVLKKQPRSLGPTRASIMEKGMIYAPRYGELDFTVPLFADFMRRRNPDGAAE
ncbi:ATP-binding protein [Sutterella sp.]|uniref:ATP-binding protein n=1 Tax=Sutterella sp. TaxID=1981025 RepID=UPI0026E06B2E|nr:ATP-binding protein [Sutterella sp.]MDO5531582.1 ATP-binding protein [Sutterella sp.]